MAKYNDWITGDGLIKVRGWARKGLTNEQIAENMGINRDTLYDWQKKYPEFSDALKSTKEITVFEVENALYKAALGYYVEESITTVTATGKAHTEIRKKWIPPNTTAQIFYLKNKDPENWRERNDITLSESNGVLESLMNLHNGKCDME